MATRSGFTNAPAGSPELVHATRRSRGAQHAVGPERRRGARGGCAASAAGRGASSLVRWTVGSRVEVGGQPAAAGVDEHHAGAVGAVARPRTCRPGRCRRARTPRCVRAPGPRRGCPGRQRRDSRGVDPAAVARAPSTRRAGCVWSRAAMAPVSRGPGATHRAATRGAGRAADGGDPGRGVGGVPVVPRLPDAPTTTMSASAAPSSARSTDVDAGAAPARHVDGEFSTSTRSATARSTAVDEVGGRAAVVGAGRARSSRPCRRRAAPAARRRRRTRRADRGSRTSTPALPAAIEAIRVPWPSSSSGDRRVLLRTPVGAEPVDEPLGADDLAVAQLRRPSRARTRRRRGSRGPRGRDRARRRTAGCRARGRSRSRRPRRPRHPEASGRPAPRPALSDRGQAADGVALDRRPPRPGAEQAGLRRGRAGRRSR